MIKEITIIGSGNIATQLGIALHKANFIIKQIISRNPITGKVLAQELQSQFVNSLSMIQEADLIIIATNDDSIEKVSNEIPDYPTVHTSGNTNLKALNKQNKYGVIYPVQSLHKDDDIDFKKIPICIEANSMKFKEEIIKVISKISSSIFCLNSNERKYIHLSAVIASNFSNHLYAIAKEILDKKKLNFNILKPLIIATASKIELNDPLTNQTGPAKRKDTKTINEHLKIIDNKNYKKIYKLISNNIIENHGN